MEMEEENSKEFSLPDWRRVEIARKACEIFIEMLQGGAENILQHTMENLGIVPIPYSKTSKRKKNVQKLLSEYGFIFQPMNDIRTFFFNEDQSEQELWKTSWHEVGHVVLGHKQESQLAEAEADFFMECAILLEANREKIKEVLPMIRETKSA